jgi:propionyl-CoA carboxylase alpha chain
MKEYTITVDGQVFEVQVLSDPRQDEVEVAVDGETFTVDVSAAVPGLAPDVAAPAQAPRPPAAPASPGQTTAAGGRRPVTPSSRSVTAPLPGTIKSVAIKPGQEVAAGDPLLVIDAMKMDNVLRATRDGVVETVLVAEGHQVAHGQPLLEYRR